MSATSQPDLVHYLPIATTVLAAIFATVLLRRYVARRSGLHLLWWGLGMVAYGLGTALESSVTLFGNSVWQTKAWYIAGALLGGYPLAQGSAYLLAARQTADRLTVVTLSFIAIVAVLVIVSPADLAAMEAHRPTGSVLAWTWVRAFTPFINLYAVAFLVGGAIYSAWRFAKRKGAGHGQRAMGNVFIAVGGILPGIGGTMAKMGMVEALYVGEFVGLLFIWIGFTLNVRAPRPTPAPLAAPTGSS